MSKLPGLDHAEYLRSLDFTVILGPKTARVDREGGAGVAVVTLEELKEIAVEFGYDDPAKRKIRWIRGVRAVTTVKEETP